MIAVSLLASFASGGLACFSKTPTTETMKGVSYEYGRELDRTRAEDG
jgi:hypothetical protein